MTRFVPRLALVALLLASASCANPVYVVGMKFVYRRAPLPASQVLRNVAYEMTSGSPKQRLDLYMPAPSTARWPTVIFIHGGSWDSGDRALTVGGADIYGNIGRFLAAHGYGAAVISYRLQPEVNWREQAGDVVKAIRWVYETSPAYGGRRDAIVLMGHSAGAQLAARAAFDASRLREAGVPVSALRGLIAVSGAGYDLADQETYDLGHDPAGYAKRFQLSPSDTGWREAASVLPLIHRQVPPVLVMYAGGETAPLVRQSQLLARALQVAGVPTTIVQPPGMSHSRIVPALSRADRPAGQAVLAFLKEILP